MTVAVQKERVTFMEMKDFAEKACRAMKEVLGEEYEVRIQEVQKNNGVILQGLLILSEKQNVSPTIYLKPFWEAYEGGVTFAELVRRMLQIYREDTPEQSIDMSFFKHFECVKDRICYRLVNAEKNKELLKKIPYIAFLDLAICFYYAYEGEALGNGTILIYHTHAELWQTDAQELMRLAEVNTRRLFPWECSSMETVVRELMERRKQDICNFDGRCEGMSAPWGIVGEEEAFWENIPMQILSNDSRVYGAACILYPGLLSEIAEKEDANLYLLPSSVHEVIIMPDSGREEPLALKSMIYEVNRTQLEPEEVLSDSLYYFDRSEKNIKVI